MQLKGGQTYEKTSENGGKAIFKDVQKGAYTISAELDETQQKKYRAADPVKITVALEPDPVELELKEIQCIKIKLVDHFGQPVADEPYAIESEDGEEIARGNLDENGKKQ